MAKKKNKSSSMAIMDFIKNMTTVTDLQYYTVELFRDVKNAFDSVNHKILLSKHEELSQ